MKKGCIFTTYPIWSDTVLKSENGVIPLPSPLRSETNNLDDKAGLYKGNWFILREGTWEIDVEAIVKGAMSIQLAMGFGTTMNNERLAYRGMVVKANTSPDEIRNARLRTIFSTSGPGTEIFLCFCADRPSIILPSERLWNNYSLRGMITQVSKEYTPAFDIRAIDRETWNYKKSTEQMMK